MSDASMSNEDEEFLFKRPHDDDLEDIFEDAVSKEDLNKKEFFCHVCGDWFSEPVWHCPVCDHHWPMSRTDCWNCHEYERPTNYLRRLEQIEAGTNCQEDPASSTTNTRNGDRH